MGPKDVVAAGPPPPTSPSERGSIKYFLFLARTVRVGYTVHAQMVVFQILHTSIWSINHTSGDAPPETTHTLSHCKARQLRQHHRTQRQELTQRQERHTRGELKVQKYYTAV